MVSSGLVLTGPYTVMSAATLHRVAAVGSIRGLYEVTLSKNTDLVFGRDEIFPPFRGIPRLYIQGGCCAAIWEGGKQPDSVYMRSH